jgi:ketosteroid isomerase-like protein
MFSWLAKRLIAHNMRRISEGDSGPTLRLDAADVHFRFPGDSSWATELKGKEALARWLRRFTEVGLQISPDEVALKGFPWRQTICVRGTDQLDSPEGERVYENRYVIWGHLRWGLLRDYEVYEDTLKTNELDAYLTDRGRLPQPPAG